MADTERSVLNLTVGFITALFIIKSIRILRPSSAVSMSVGQPYVNQCTSCGNKTLTLQ